MPIDTYPWKRFWHRREGRISLEDAGFLIDPDSEYGRYCDQEVLSFDAATQSPCTVLLGEPGIGKSTALRSEFDTTKAGAEAGDVVLFFDLRDYASDDRLERKLFQHEEIKGWLHGQHKLHLFLDSLDEGLLRIDNISRVMLSELGTWPAERLRLRISSRPAEWPASLEDGFEQLWGKGRVDVFTMAPLRRRDVACAAETRGLKPDNFISELIRADVVPLAIKPVTLEMLINSFARDGALPPGRSELYSAGCRLLCEEQSKTRTESPRLRGSLTPPQRMLIAGRLAALSQFSNRSAFWLGIESGLEPQDIAVAVAVGGSVCGDDAEATVDYDGIREVLDTGLFLASGLNRQSWRHQTYAEFLAAFYLNVNHVELDELRILFLHPDRSLSVVPQLRETAAWLASMNAEFFHLISRVDPEVLLRSDLSKRSRKDCSYLAERLLQFVGEGGRLHSLRSQHWSFAQLASPELPSVIKPYLSDRAKPQDSRVAAISMAGECKLTELAPNLTQILEDTTEETLIRKHAIIALRTMGASAAANTVLRALAAGRSGADSDDDLKGLSLQVLWPQSLPTRDLFKYLRPPKTTDYLGAYWRFLNSDITTNLGSRDLPRALAWVRRHPEGSNNSSFLHKLVTAILNRALDSVGEPGVAALLALVLIDIHRSSSSSELLSDRLRDSPDSIKRPLVRALVPLVRGAQHGGFLVMHECMIATSDVSWLLIELSNSHIQPDRELWAELIAMRLYGSSIEDFDAVLEAAKSDFVLQDRIQPYISAIQLDSPLAQQLRADHARQATVHQQGAAPQPSLDQAVTAILATQEPNTYFLVHRCLHNHNNSPHESTDPLPGWADLSGATRAGVLMAARLYLKTRPASPAGTWWKHGQFSFGMVAGASALQLLALESLDSLEALTDDDWQFWMPLILSYRVEPKHALDLVWKKAYWCAQLTFLSTIEDVIEGENARYGRVFAIRDIAAVWDDRLATLLRNKLLTLKPAAFKDVIAVLLAMEDHRTKELLSQMTRSDAQGSPDDRRRTVFANVEMLIHDPQHWKILWPRLQLDKPFCIDILQTIASEHESSRFPQGIDPGDVADLCIWMAGMGLDNVKPDPEDLGLVTPPVALSHWWNALVNSLSQQGTFESCRALEQMISALPQYAGWLKYSLRRAEDAARRVTWTPPGPTEVLALAQRDQEPRLVISLHGIRTHAPWQKEVTQELQNAGFHHQPLDYGYFWAFQLLIPWARKKKIDWFVRKYQTCVVGRRRRPSIIAHSFGTYIVANTLLKYPEIAFDRLIFCGSIVRRDYDWSRLFARAQGHAVLNEYGERDRWPRLAGWVVSDAGPSGSAGFLRSDPALYQRIRARFGHSDFFYGLNYEKNWVPFLRGHIPDLIPQQSRTTKTRARRLWLCLALICAIGLAVFLILPR